MSITTENAREIARQVTLGVIDGIVECFGLSKKEIRRNVRAMTETLKEANDERNIPEDV